MGRKVTRNTEYSAFAIAERDQWMQGRIRYYGNAGLTVQEYNAIIHSLHGLPEVAGLAMELPCQDYIAKKMNISQARVSQLLTSAERVLYWLEDQDTPDVGWYKRGRDWVFHAPTIDHPLPTAPVTRVKRVTIHRAGQSYRLSFAGDYSG